MPAIRRRAVGFQLLDMERRNAFRPGDSSAADWAKSNLDRKRADKLILLSRRLEELPRIRLGQRFAGREAQPPIPR